MSFGMVPSHLPRSSEIERWPVFTKEAPLSILVSACVTGVACGTDATAYGAPYPHTARLLALPNVRPVPFCPEDFAFGTPRAIPDIHGGTGFDVLDGRAHVISSTGEDWTAPMLEAAHAMLDLARREHVRLALLMDISAACGSQVIYLGARSDGVYQRGPGVGAALLIRNGIPVFSPRDHRTLGAVVHALDPDAAPDPGARDHHESDWYVEHFGV
jgi:uncharacterized protein YbbK (DUF523 family)